MPRDEFFDFGLGFRGETLSFALGAGDNRLCLALGFLLLASVGGKQGLGFRLEPERLIEL